MELDLCNLSWTLVGWVPYTWAWLADMGQGPGAPAGEADPADYRKHQCTPQIPAQVPGSVQDDLRRAGLLPDWNEGLNAPLCEWVEHRHWEYRATFTAPVAWEGQRIVLRAEGLDYAGQVLVDGQPVGQFQGTLMPHEFDLTAVAKPGVAQRLSIIILEAPHEQGQLGYTSRSHYYKPRYAYGWDWCPRLVPLGIWEPLTLLAVGAVRLHNCLPAAAYDAEQESGSLTFRLDVESRNALAAQCVVRVTDGERLVYAELLTCAFAPGRSESQLALSEALNVEAWWPNGLGAHKLYHVSLALQAQDGQPLAAWEGRVGFRRVRWLPCVGAPANAEPWICEVNGRTVFLQGFNWTPVRMTSGSVTPDLYAHRLGMYADMGANILRVWGGAVLEKEVFYDLCDELGILVWQEFPLSSSGAENTPPHGAEALAKLADVAASYIWRRGGHAALLAWCGGNELTAHDGRNTPVNASDPAIAALGAAAARLAPQTRYLATSPSGPSFGLDPARVGQGLHHDTHGPWEMRGTLQEWQTHWEGHDALFVSEAGVPSCSSLETLQRYAGGMTLWPPSLDGPFWRYRSPWWVQWDYLAERYGFTAERDELARYVQVSQALQAQGLAILVASCKRRFPRCGGVILWMGHDCYPCSANTAVIEYDGQPKPAVAALKAVFEGEIAGS